MWSSSWWLRVHIRRHWSQMSCELVTWQQSCHNHWQFYYSCLSCDNHWQFYYSCLSCDNHGEFNYSCLHASSWQDVKLHPHFHTTLNCIHIFIVTGSLLYWCVMRPASQRFFIHRCIYLFIIPYLATYLGTNSLSVVYLFWQHSNIYIRHIVYLYLTTF